LSSIPTSTSTPYTGPTLGDLLKNAFPNLANKTTDHPPPEPADPWVDGLFLGLHDPTEPSSTKASPTTAPSENAAAILPLIMGPGPYIPQNISMSWPHPHLHALPTTTVSNLETIPTVINDLGPEDEDAVRKFFSDLSHEEEPQQVKRQLSTPPPSLIISPDDDIPSLLSSPSPQSQCELARQTLMNRITTYRTQLQEPCGLGKDVQVPVPLQPEMQNATERVCTLKRQRIVKAYREVQGVLAGRCQGAVAYVAQ
jgi:hypothetical protein